MSVHAPHFRLEDLVKLDNRVEAHLDGLRGRKAGRAVRAGTGNPRVRAATRHLPGAHNSEAQCLKVLREGFQRQRAAAALELALTKPDAHLFEVRAPGWRQQRLLNPN